ncbi:MAG: glutamine synthetase family protein [Candidatus Bathyarchaeota archaeon]|nr:glutamine synthetase family protein [Candidatus Bathyarchaeota archaeon]
MIGGEAFLVNNKIEFLEIMFVDLSGRLKSMTVPVRPVEKLTEVAKDPAMSKGTNIDGSSVIGFSKVEMSDLHLTPDPDSLVELPYAPDRRAAVMSYVYARTQAGKDLAPFDGDPRNILRRAQQKYLGSSKSLRLKVEPEFFFVTSDGQPYDQASYADTRPKNLGADIMLEISRALRSIPIEINLVHHEGAPSQQEIELDFGPIMKMADSIVLFKNIVRAIAADKGIDVTFMPKPFGGVAGSGMHCHMQLWEGDKNLFATERNDEISEAAKHFVAGLLKHASAITSIANPTINSYKRLVPGYEAPVYISWGYVNRTTLVRVPMFGKSEKAAIEFRSPDPSCNPYLLFASLLAAGMDGVKNELEAPEARTEDLFKLSPEELRKIGVQMLPPTLNDALDAFERDELMREVLGDHAFNTFLRLKQEEWKQYANVTVTDWEWSKYKDV